MIKKSILIGHEKSGNPNKFDKGAIANKRVTIEDDIPRTFNNNEPIGLSYNHLIIFPKFMQYHLRFSTSCKFINSSF